MTPLISLSTSDEGNILSIKDVTTYTSPTRDEVALIIAWSKDGFVADWNFDFGNPNPGQWNEMITNGYTYTVLMFAGYQYDALLDVAFGIKSIVFDNGNFYIKYTSGTVTFSSEGIRPSYDPANWALLAVGTVVAFGADPEMTLTNEDIYDLIIESIGLSNEIAMTTSIIDVNFNIVFLEKLSCHSHRIRNNSSKLISSVILSKYNGDVLITYDGADTIEIDISADNLGDGAYIVKVIFDDDTYLEYPLIDFCDAYYCYKSLFQYVTCNCSNPCSPSSDCDELLQTKINDMNSIKQIIDEVLLMVNLNASRNMGVYGIMDSERSFVLDIGLLLAKLKIVTSRCGFCGS